MSSSKVIRVSLNWKAGSLNKPQILGQLSKSCVRLETKKLGSKHTKERRRWRSESNATNPTPHPPQKNKHPKKTRKMRRNLYRKWKFDSAGLLVKINDQNEGGPPQNRYIQFAVETHHRLDDLKGIISLWSAFCISHEFQENLFQIQNIPRINSSVETRCKMASIIDHRSTELNLQEHCQSLLKSNPWSIQFETC